MSMKMGRMRRKIRRGRKWRRGMGSDKSHETKTWKEENKENSKD